MKMLSFIIALIVAGTVSSCSKGGDDQPGPNQPPPNQPPQQEQLLKGKVTDSRGNVIQGATIVSEHMVYYNSYTSGVSDANGNFKVDIPSNPAGSWSAKAQITKTAWGQTYTFDLHPSTVDPYTKEGAVRNFVWKLSGVRPTTNAMYGAHVDLYQFGTDADMTQVKLIFTPVEATLIDGSPAAVIERNVVDEAGTFMAKDIPIGKYTVKAVYAGKTMLLDYRNNSGNPEEVKTVVFGKNGYLAATEYNATFWLSEK